jgi:hypothetical protein
MWVSRTTSAPSTSRKRASSRLAGSHVTGGHVEDRAVVLAQPDRAVGRQLRGTQVALLVLDHGQLADPFEERRVGTGVVIEAALDSFGGLRSARLEDTFEEVLAADRVDRRDQPARQAVVVGREQLLGSSVTSYRWRGRPTPWRSVRRETSPRSRGPGAAAGRRSGWPRRGRPADRASWVRPSGSPGPARAGGSGRGPRGAPGDDPRRDCRQRRPPCANRPGAAKPGLGRPSR